MDRQEPPPFVSESLLQQGTAPGPRQASAVTGRIDGRRRLCHTAGMKYTVIETISDTLARVKRGDAEYIRETVRFPRDQKDIFDLMMQGKSMPEVEADCLAQVKALGKELDLLQLVKPDSRLVRPVEYEIMKIPGGTGWQAEILKPRLLPLSVLQRYHTLTAEEEKILTDQLADGLREAQKARLRKSRVKESDVYVSAENQFLLDLTGSDWPDEAQEDLETLEILADLVSDPDLRQQLKNQPLFDGVSE